MDSETAGYFTIVSDSAIDLDEISVLLGRSATSEWTPETRSASGRLLKRNWGWQLASELEAGSTPEQHVVHLADVLHEYREALARFLAGNPVKATIDVVLECNEDANPQMFLEPALIARVSAMGVAIWLDIYT